MPWRRREDKWTRQRAGDKGGFQIRALAVFCSDQSGASRCRAVSRATRRTEMRLLMLIATMAVAAATLLATAPRAAAQSCQQLWVERNSYYKRAGYCFKTRRAIDYFGNGGCMYDSEGDLPLSPGERRRIAEISRLERAYGCN
jgi:hypothetical protein